MQDMPKFHVSRVSTDEYLGCRVRLGQDDLGTSDGLPVTHLITVDHLHLAGRLLSVDLRQGDARQDEDDQSLHPIIRLNVQDSTKLSDMDRNHSPDAVNSRLEILRAHK
jgi:hypothetical protein